MNVLFEKAPAEATKDEWLTPPPLIHKLGSFDLDPCSPINRPWPTAANHYTELDNGLIQPWHGRVWCNPPYSDIEPWLRKCANHNNAIAMIFARTETQAFFRQVWNKADSILFIAGRIQFYHVTGVCSKRNAGAPSVLIAYGSNNVDALEESGIQGKHILVNYQRYIVVAASPTWFSVVSIAVRQSDEEGMKPIYDIVSRLAPDKISRNPNWKAKIRQQLQVIRKQRASHQTINL